MVFSYVTPCILVGVYQVSKKGIVFILGFKIYPETEDSNSPQNLWCISVRLRGITP